jgi:hypothetical protein|tara:strand:+ start:307 stop:561 length:255 start_codon:yes stop_codon:yes gene_type:complete
MPKSRHRKNQKQRSEIRTNKLKSDIKKRQEAQQEQYQQLLSDAQSQRDANNQNNEQELKDMKMASTNISIDTTKGGEISGVDYK